MISSIILFLLVAIAITIYTMYSFWWLVTLILLLLLLIVSIKAIHESKKFGKGSLFRAFHKYPEENEQLNLVEFILNKEVEKSAIFRLDKEIIVCLAQSGVYLIKVLDYVGRVTGKENEPTFQLSGKFASLIPNFFLELEQLEGNLKNNVAHLTIKKLIVKKETCIIEAPYSFEHQIIGINNLYYTFRNMNKEKYYTDAQLLEIQNFIAEYLSKSVNL